MTLLQDSVPFFKLSFLSHVQFITFAISLIRRLKYLYSFFSSHFYFLDFVVLLFVLKIFQLILLLLASVISLCLISFEYSSNP